MRVVALIPAAGKAERMGGPVKKQFLPLVGRPVLAQTLLKFEGSPSVNGIIPIVDEGDLSFVAQELLPPLSLKKVLAVVPGGLTRQESVMSGLGAAGEGWDIVVIHDGVRPLVPLGLIEEVISSAFKFGAVTAALPARDTVRLMGADGRFEKTLERERVVLIQTPQAFLYPLIKEAHLKAREDGFVGTDDAALVERLGYKVVMIEGSPLNIKITTREDMALAEAILRGQGCG